MAAVHSSAFLGPAKRPWQLGFCESFLGKMTTCQKSGRGPMQLCWKFRTSVHGGPSPYDQFVVDVVGKNDDMS